MHRLAVSQPRGFGAPRGLSEFLFQREAGQSGFDAAQRIDIGRRHPPSAIRIAAIATGPSGGYIGVGLTAHLWEQSWAQRTGRRWCGNRHSIEGYRVRDEWLGTFRVLHAMASVWNL